MEDLWVVSSSDQRGMVVIKVSSDSPITNLLARRTDGMPAV